MNFKQYIKEERLDEVLITLGNRPKFGQVVLLAGGAGCFDGDTLVETDQGPKKIKDIKPGTLVQSFNNGLELKEVIDTFKHSPDKEIIELEFDDGTKIVCTEDHEFLVDKYIPSIELLDQELNIRSDTGTVTVKVVKITKRPKQITYDLEVKDNHCYCLTTNSGPIVVHNSGKGFMTKKLLGIDARTLDVDEIKGKIVSKSTPKLNKKILDKYGIDVTTLDLRNPDNVALLHKINDEMGISAKVQKQFFGNHHKDRLPNVVFDTTMKSIKKIESIVDTVKAAGYKKENIHLIWIMNDVEVAKSQNRTRDRVVPEDILIDTHQGVAQVMQQMLVNSRLDDYFGGFAYVVFNKQAVDNTLVFSEYGGNYVKDALILKVKERNKKQIPYSSIASDFIRKIRSYVPKPAKRLWENWNK